MIQSISFKCRTEQQRKTCTILRQLLVRMIHPNYYIFRSISLCINSVNTETTMVSSSLNITPNYPGCINSNLSPNDQILMDIAAGGNIQPIRFFAFKYKVLPCGINTNFYEYKENDEVPSILHATRWVFYRQHTLVQITELRLLSTRKWHITEFGACLI